MIATSDAGIMPLRSVRILISEIVTGIGFDDQNPNPFSRKYYSTRWCDFLHLRPSKFEYRNNPIAESRSSRVFFGGSCQGSGTNQTNENMV